MRRKESLGLDDEEGLRIRRSVLRKLKLQAHRKTLNLI